jgi:hypothetical protein
MKGMGIAELERDIKVEKNVEPIAWAEDVFFNRMWRKVARSNWRASTDRRWKCTLDILRGDHDEDLVVTPAHEEVVKDLQLKSSSKKRKVEEDEHRSNESSDQPATKKSDSSDDNLNEAIVEAIIEATTNHVVKDDEKV